MFICLGQCTTTADSEFKKNFNDVLLLTMDDTEFNEAQKILDNVEIPSKKDESDKNRWFGEIGSNKVTLLKAPHFGKTGASSGHDVLVYETIQELKPKAIVSLGVCDGVRKEAHFLGDVVVSSQVYFPERQEEGLSNFDRTTYDCNLGLVHLFDRGKFAWVGPCENVVIPKVHVGQFTTGLQDGDDKKRDSHKAGTIGIDTASKRVYVTCQNSGVPWLSCKSIAKWANDEYQNSTWCQFGAAVSASYVQHVLKRFYIPDEVQVFDKSVPKTCLPPMVPHFVGRQQKVEDISRTLMSTSTRLVSVSGPPGFGKTSLAIAAGHQLRQLGLPVYFLSLRSAKTAEELISDLLNTFAHTSSDVTGRERSKLCGLLSAIPSSICIILDNADVLFESGGETSQEVLDLLEKIFSHCKNVSFLLTTRTSLQTVLGRKFAGHTFVDVASLDRKSSQKLVKELVPAADESECCRVAEICGDVPLAIKLLCGQIVEEKSASQFLDHFSRSSKTIVALLDDPDAPSDQRLNLLFESYFKRLSREEQEAFVCLSVFVSEVFDEQAAVNVIGGDENTAKKTLLRLKRKYLVDGNSSGAVLSFHPLIRSFGLEKAADMKEIARDAEKRFLNYYIKLFEDLNNQFLAGNSLLVFRDFEFNKQNMVHCLSEDL
ncbi:WD repeat-containing alr2800 [Paramuricea clavata]|uniref:WD repeat-containing alr2800 n=1 Tax=Paramuricea clavata TaxID=317549 RepID=A0A6S7JU90_PARCT|nr:WD repeat-containing alr2800 [Paramuricea clavata]